MRFARALSLYVSSSCVRLAFVSPHAARITPHKSRFISIEAGDEADRYPSIYLFQRWRRRRGRNPSKIYWTGFNWLDVARFDTKSFHVESLDGGRNRNSRKLPRSWRKNGSIGRRRVFRLFWVSLITYIWRRIIDVFGYRPKAECADHFRSFRPRLQSGGA